MEYILNNKYNNNKIKNISNIFKNLSKESISIINKASFEILNSTIILNTINQIKKIYNSNDILIKYTSNLYNIKYDDDIYNLFNKINRLNNNIYNKYKKNIFINSVKFKYKIISIKYRAYNLTFNNFFIYSDCLIKQNIIEHIAIIFLYLYINNNIHSKIDIYNSEIILYYYFHPRKFVNNKSYYNMYINGNLLNAAGFSQTYKSCITTKKNDGIGLFIHELFHFFGYDINISKIFTDNEQYKNSNIKTDKHELITNTYATILNCIFNVIYIKKNDLVDIDEKIMFKYFIKLEIINSLVLSSKYIKIFKINSMLNTYGKFNDLNKYNNFKLINNYYNNINIFLQIFGYVYLRSFLLLNNKFIDTIHSNNLLHVNMDNVNISLLYFDDTLKWKNVIINIFKYINIYYANSKYINFDYFCLNII
jgi:hypothetical protein